MSSQAKAAKFSEQEKFTARKACAGRAYEVNLEELNGRRHQGAYRAAAVSAGLYFKHRMDGARLKMIFAAHWPALSANASPDTSRCLTHDKGQCGFARLPL